MFFALDLFGLKGFINNFQSSFKTSRDASLKSAVRCSRANAAGRRVGFTSSRDCFVAYLPCRFA
jgi:hypothetical protein